MGLLDVLVVTAMVAFQAAELPPPFPRPGTTKLLENDAVAVWNVSWLKQKFPLHTHRYDLVGDCLRGRRSDHHAGRRPGPAGSHQGLGVSDESSRCHPRRGRRERSADARGADRGEDIRAAGRSRRTGRGLRQVAGAPAWQNNRAAAWLMMAGRRLPRIGTSATPSSWYSKARRPRRRSCPPERFTPARRPKRRARVHLRDQVGGSMKRTTARRRFLTTCALAGAAAARPLAAFGQAVDKAQQASAPSALRITE